MAKPDKKAAAEALGGKVSKFRASPSKATGRAAVDALKNAKAAGLSDRQRDRIIDNADGSGKK